MLEITGISKTFNPGTINEKQALRDVSLTLQDGDFATIVGSNGAGKSTLFNAIAGSFIVDEGAIILDGKDITFEKEHRRAVYIGRLFQDPLMGAAPRGEPLGRLPSRLTAQGNVLENHEEGKGALPGAALPPAHGS